MKSEIISEMRLMPITNLRRRVDRLAATAPPACPDAFHVTWHTVVADLETNELPPRPRCPSCNAPADLVIEIVYEREGWRRLNDSDVPTRRTTVKW